MARTISPLHTPLQPQTSASSASAATREPVPVAGIAQMGLAEQQMLAELGDVGAVAHELEVPGAVEGIAVHHRALDALVLHHQLLVDAAARRPANTISSLSSSPMKSPAENRSMPVTLSLVEVSDPS